jgi:hypothetical protein
MPEVLRFSECILQLKDKDLDIRICLNLDYCNLIIFPSLLEYNIKL